MKGDTDMSVDYIDHMGSDLSVVNAARVSFDKESKWELQGTEEFMSCLTDDIPQLGLSEKDTKLIQFLARGMTTEDFDTFLQDVADGVMDYCMAGDDDARGAVLELLWNWRRTPEHFVPFAHPHVTFRIKAPIFVARQLGKHQVGMVWSEVSRRYVDSEPEFFVPEVWRKRAENVKQGSSEEPVTLTKIGKCHGCGKPISHPKRFYCSSACQADVWRKTNPYRSCFIRWKAVAKRSDIPFTITEDDLDWPTICPYLDIPLVYGGNDRQRDTASLDKIVPELGYVPGNVQIISLLANKMKSEATQEEIIKFAKNAALIHGGVFMQCSSSYESFLEEATNTYNHLIEDGVAPELARMMLPQSTLVEWIWTGSLYGWANVYNKRKSGSHSQRECWPIAEAIGEHMGKLFPVSWEALTQ